MLKYALTINLLSILASSQIAIAAEVANGGTDPLGYTEADRAKQVAQCDAKVKRDVAQAAAKYLADFRKAGATSLTPNFKQPLKCGIENADYIIHFTSGEECTVSIGRWVNRQGDSIYAPSDLPNDDCSKIKLRHR